MRMFCGRRMYCGRNVRAAALAGLMLTVTAGGARRLCAQTTEPAPIAATEHATAPAAPAEEPKGGLLDADPGTAFFTVLIFVTLLVILRVTAWKPILGGLKDRERAIRDSIEAANKAKAEAERTTRDLEARMAEVQRQGAAQLQQAKADAQKVADTIRSQAEADSNALKDRTLREIDAAKQQAVAEINTHAAELGTAVARKILQRNVTVDDQQRLVEQSLAEMAKKN